MDEVIQVDPLTALGEHIAGALGGVILANEISYGELTLTIERDAIVAVATFLRDDAKCRFISFTDVTAVDYPERDERFDVVYHFMSPQLNQRIRIKLTTDDTMPVPSITGVFRGADWFERETYDLYGVLFSGHNDLRRILTDYGFDGHPLRKDFPVTGFVQVKYDEERKRVVYEPVKLMQEFRTFDYLSPWEGTDYVLPGDEKAKQ
ncbi:NADH-quinone oxidoreductase subunit C [Devosia neptuniae]|jgi:NADH-quinone oxidoreductase subunit C|uniref:NADH-quinone oxidoreductase subunit C n=1 Tax=Devosia neptuniae TaxID=191302 RepID=A0ABY6CE11_9HYPH|nr:NADH-quinone oxidoreductase subunit C [Devosia neptuniae]UXN69402.1 NADH-quinone oxidoreductase subunit C [Devosia neptuniae]